MTEVRPAASRLWRRGTHAAHVVAATETVGSDARALVHEPLASSATTAAPPGARPARRAGTRTHVLAAARDLTALLLASALTWWASDEDLSTALFVAFALVSLVVLIVGGGYAQRLKLDVLDDLRLVVTSTAVGAMAALSVAQVSATTATTTSHVVELWVLASASLAAARTTATTLQLRRRRLHDGARAVIIGAGLVGRLVAERLLAHPEFGLRPVGFLDKEPVEIDGKPLPLPVLGASWDIEEAVAEHDVEYAVVTFSNAPHDVFLWLLDECAELGVRPLVVPRLFERVPSRLRVTHVGGLPLLELLPVSPRSFHYVFKYALDRVAALLLLALLAPLLAVLTLAVLLSLGRPILYRQHRVGLDGRHFEMLKFRSMRPPTHDDEHVLEFQAESGPGGVEGVDRRTRVGTFLRLSSLDELPQLINVLKGEMSLVGPRPERPEFAEYFATHVRRYESRHRVKAGITGWAQISGLRGKTSIADRIEWDNYYIENFSLWLDLKILLLTPVAVIRNRAE